MDTKGIDGRNRQCKQCHRAYARQYNKKHPPKKQTPEQTRAYWLKKKYGITPAVYHRMLKLQKGSCAICGHRNGSKRLAIDHDHRIGLVRGLLCTRCNFLVGQIEASEKVFDKAIVYLRKWRGWWKRCAKKELYFSVFST
jgi:hypothetical protein